MQKDFKQLETAAKRAYTRGLQTGNGGNLSVRYENRMIVKSSGGSFADCDAYGNGFVETDLDGTPVIENSVQPTREVYLHGLMYKISPKIGGVVHTHSPWAISWSYSGKPLPMITLHVQLKFGCEIPVIDVPNPSVRPCDSNLILPYFEKNPDLPAFILAGHGIVAVGKDVLTAEHNAELVEETAQICILRKLLLKDID